jgi:hypothetical protein
MTYLTGIVLAGETVAFLRIFQRFPQCLKKPFAQGRHKLVVSAYKSYGQFRRTIQSLLMPLKTSTIHSSLFTDNNTAKNRDNRIRLPDWSSTIKPAICRKADTTIIHYSLFVIHGLPSVRAGLR